MPEKPVVAHLNFTFFARSQTFIYFYLRHFQRTHPICLSLHTPIVHRHRFPFPAQDAYGFPPRLPWLIARAWERWHLPGHARLRRLVNGSEAARRRWMIRLLRARGARLIHAHFGGTAYRALPVAEALGLPLVTTFYGVDIMGEPSWQNWPQHRQQVFQRSTLVLAEGPFMRQRLIALGCPAEKVVIQPIALEMDRLPFRERRPHPGPPRLIFAGRFEEKKGLLEALDALALLQRQGVAFTFAIIGSGRLKSAVQQRIRAHGLQERVHLLGFLDYDAYLAAMQQADIFLHPSRTARDGDSEGGAPTVILEAQALGLPVVATTHADIPYITRPGESALLVPEGDVAALAEALERLIRHPERWAAMGRAGRAHVESRHDIRHQAPRLERRYLDLIQGGVGS